MSIHSDNNGVPGTELAKSSTISTGLFGSAEYSILGGGTSKILHDTATLSTRLEITADTSYWIVAKKTGACYVSTYESGTSLYSTDFSTWVNWGAGASRTSLVN
jgi:hypothetical protein